MSDQEANDMTLRELVRHSLNMLEQQREDNDKRTEMLYSIVGDMKAFCNVFKTNKSTIK